MAALVYGFRFLRASPDGERTFFKTAPVGALAVLTVVLGGPPLLLLGLAASALGDAFLARESERTFLAGVASFLVAHVAYVALFLDIGGAFASPLRLIAAALVLVYAGLFARFLWPRLGDMRLPVAVYIVAIAAMGVAAAGAPLALWPVMAGAALFIVSDSALALERFAYQAAPRRWTGPVVWWTYYAAQVLIASAFLCPAFGVRV